MIRLVFASTARRLCLPLGCSMWRPLLAGLIVCGMSSIGRQQQAAAQTQVMIEVTSANVPVMGGSQQLATASLKSRFVVQGLNGPWQLITVETPDGTKQGWIHQDHTRKLFLPPKTPLRPTTRITPEQVEQAKRSFDALFEAEKWPEAAQAGEQFLLLYYRGLGSEDRYTATVETLLGFCYAKLFRYYEAEQFYQHSIGVLERFPEAKSILANSLSMLAELYRQTGQYAKGESLAARHLKLAESIHGPEHLSTAHSLAMYGALLTDSGKYGEAESVVRRAMVIYERERQGELFESMLTSLGVIFERTGRLDVARTTNERALQLGEVRVGKDHVRLTGIRCNLAKVHEKLGNYAEAEAIYLQTLATMDRSAHDNVRERADVLAGLGTVQTDLSKFGEAGANLIKALSLMEAAAGPDSLEVAPIHWVLGRMYYHLHREELAEKHLLRGMKIYEARLGRGDSNFVHVAQLAAIVYKDLGRLDEAARLMEELIETSKRIRQSYWTLLVNLGGVRKAGGNLDEAARLYAEALELGKQEAGESHPHVALALSLLSEVYLEQPEHLAKAESLLTQAIQIQESRLGRDHPELATNLRFQAGLYERMGRTEEATKLFDRARRIAHIHLRKVLPAFSEPEQLDYLGTQKGAFFAALSLALEHPNDQAIIEHAAEWLLNGKAVLHEVLAERTLVARSAGTPELAAMANELDRVRKQLASLTLSTEEDLQRRNHRLSQLAEREQELQKELGLAGGRQASAAQWVELAEVRAALPKDAVLVEIVNMHRFKFEGSPLSQQADFRYVAWMIPPAGDGEVQLVDLGSEQEITAAVRKHLESTDTAIDQIADLGEAEAEQHFRDVLKPIAERVLRPLEGSIAGKRHWIISPDWYLWAVPWAALPLSDGRYAVEEHVISCRTSGRHLWERPTAGEVPPGMTAAVFADPDYDLDPQQIARMVNPASTDLAMRGASVADRVPRNWLRLPGTSEEATALLPHLTTWLGDKPTMYQREQALEDHFKQVQRPRALILSTHGYFLIDDSASDTDDTVDQQAKSLPPKGTSLDNPLLRCGLVLAGANRRNASAGGIDDGILTGLEIVGADLRGTELVVLSACQTAGGIVSEGGGVIGLQHAFQLSGARTTVATLWSIPDRETAQLMSQFWQQMARKKSKAESLRDAQLTMIDARRRTASGAHPFFWAAFTLTGAPE